MTISSTTRKAGPYTGNGVQTVFAFAFKVFTSADVLLTKSVAGVESTLTLTTDYTVSLNADQDAAPGGSVTLVAALPNGALLTISSQVDSLQSVLVTNAGGFFPTVFNTVFDKLTILVQQLAEKSARTLKAPITDAAAELVLPTATQRASKYLAFDASGAPIAAADPAAGLGAIVASDQPANAKWQIVIADTEPAYIDNALTIQNNSNAGGLMGNAAIRFRAGDGYERAAIGYSALALGADPIHPTIAAAFYPNTAYVEFGNLQAAAAARDTDFAAVCTQVAGAAHFPSTSTKMLLCSASSGQITLNTIGGSVYGTGATIQLNGEVAVGAVGNMRALQLGLKTTLAMIREGDVDDLLRISANADNSDAKQNAAKTAWQMRLGYGTGLDRWEVRRQATGTSAWTTPMWVDAVGVNTPAHLFGTIGAPGYGQFSMNSTWARFRERDANDQFAITTNVDTGTTKDAVGLAAWRMSMGAGLDTWKLSRMPSGSSSWTDLLTVTATVITAAVPIKDPSFTVGTVPSAAGAGAGASIFVTNEIGGAVTAFSDATNWRRVTDRAIVS